MNRSLVAMIAMTAICILSEASEADPIAFIDQEQDTVTTARRFDTDVHAQSFVPTFAGIEALDLVLQDQTNGGGSWQVKLWAGSVGGTLLGTSSIASIAPGGPPGPRAFYFHFHFFPLIPLTPGETYFLQPEVVSGDAFNLVFHYSNANPYAGGMLFFNGVPQPGNDLRFIEGTHDTPPPPIPEPGVLVLLGLGVAVHARRQREGAGRTRLKQSAPR